MNSDGGGEAASRPHLGGVESLRGYAAFCVIVFHVIYIAPFDPPSSLMFLKWHMGRGVPLFFAVSAFSLGYGYFGRLQTRPQLQAFYVRRFFRIAPLYYADLAFQFWSSGALRYIFAHRIQVFLSLTFLFNLSPQYVEGIAPASWSMGVEMLFYAVLPLVFIGARTLASAVMLTISSCVVAVFYFVVLSRSASVPPAFIEHGLLFNAPYFGFGLIAFHLWRRQGRQRPLLALAFGAGLAAMLILAAGVLGAAIGSPLGSAIYQTLWGAPFAAICLGFAWRAPALLSNAVTRYLGRISFSLYLVHPHVIPLLARAGAYDWARRLPGGSGVTFPATVLLTGSVVVLLSAILHRLIEEPGIALGRRLSRRLQDRSRAAVRSPESAGAA